MPLQNNNLMNNNKNYLNNNVQGFNNDMNLKPFVNNMNNNLPIEYYINENTKLKEQINNLQQEIKILNNNLQNANQNIINIQQQQIDYINQINTLKNQLKDKELNDIKNGLTKDGYVNYNNIMVVNFISGDGKINYGIKCLPTDTFAQVEEKLYQIYEEYREMYNNTFLAKGRVIKRFKTMSENNIKNGDKVQLQNLNE